MVNIFPHTPVRVGLVGTGYAAKLRAEALQADGRSRLVAVAGHTPTKTAEFAETHRATPYATWRQLVTDPDLDLIMVGNANAAHGAVVRAALEARKAVVVEYPLSIDVAEAEALVALAAQGGLFLHVEHIELLGGLHQAMIAHLPAIGTPTYVRYSTAVPQTPAPPKWTYHAELFGFPLVGALSRLHRLTNLFGSVDTVACQTQYDDGTALPFSGYFKTCRCVAQLRFHSGLVAEILYSKGEGVWDASRRMVVEGTAGAMVFDGDEGTLIQSGNQPQKIEVEGRRGLFLQDTQRVLDALVDRQPLYVTPESSLYALRVAAAAQQAALTGQTIPVVSRSLTL